MFTELRGTDVWRQSIHVYRPPLKPASPRTLQARRYGPSGVVCDVMTCDTSRSREIHRGPDFAGRVANRVGARHCVGDSYSHFFSMAPLDAPRGADGLARLKFLLAHLSDPHVGPMPRPRRLELIGKRVTGYLNWTRSRSRIHDMAVLEQIVSDMKTHHPSHVAMTGDISNIGLPAEFQLARNWLETLGAPEDVSFVPGNHDAYVRGSLPYLARTFAPWTTGEASAGEGFPYLRIRGEVALVGLSSGVPTPLFIAAGYLGHRQLQAAERLLVETGRRGLVRVVMLHHPPHTAASQLGRGLVDAGGLAALIRRAGAELIVHGHNHRLSLARMDGPKGVVPVVGVPSASAIRGTPHQPAGYHLFEISGSGTDCKIAARARGLLPGTAAVGDLGPLVP
jgi:3',5'-cyclic AMP phosphodiesterase CpdA